MFYDEYLKCADKHLRGCLQLLQSFRKGTANDCHVWLELYYLSGYIVEGITIYSAYKLNNWTPSDDIQYDYNLQFTQHTNLDFYDKRTKIINGIETIDPFFQNRPPGALSVQHHRFQEIAKTLLKPDPSFNDVPYIGNGVIDADIEDLIDKWKPDVRYHYHGMRKKINVLNYDIITRLLTTCSTIYIKHI